MLALLLRLLAVPVSAFTVGFSKVPQSLVVRPHPPAMFLDADLDLFSFLLDDFVTVQRRLDILLNETGMVSGHSLLQRSSLPEVGSLDELRSSSDEMSVEESDEGYTVTLSAPGVSADDLHVNVEDSMLKVAGEMRRRDSNSRFRSSFRRSMPLPPDADGDVLSTTYADGKLVVALSKAAPPFDEGDEPRGRAATSSEAEQLAAETPRFARWLRVHGGYLNTQADAKGEVDGDEPEI